MLVVFALAGCAPPIGALRVSAGGTADTLWQVPRRTIYETTPLNNRFIPSEDLLVFVSYKGVVNTVPITQVKIELCKNPNAAELEFTSIDNPPPGATNGYHRFYDEDKGKRYLVRVFYNGMYSEPYSIQVGALIDDDDDNGGDGGIIYVWRPLVTFNSNGGTPVPSQRLEPWGLADESKANTTKAGYDFGGWYTTRNLTKLFDFNTPVEISITLYAKWNPKP